MRMHPEGKSCSDLGRVLALDDPPAWSEGNQFMFQGRWFARPEETHTGRHGHHKR
jgi:hypothetical protein